MCVKSNDNRVYQTICTDYGYFGYSPTKYQRIYSRCSTNTRRKQRVFAICNDNYAFFLNRFCLKLRPLHFMLQIQFYRSVRFIMYIRVHGQKYFKKLNINTLTFSSWLMTKTYWCSCTYRKYILHVLTSLFTTKSGRTQETNLQ